MLCSLRILELNVGQITINFLKQILPQILLANSLDILEVGHFFSKLYAILIPYVMGDCSLL